MNWTNELPKEAVLHGIQEGAIKGIKPAREPEIVSQIGKLFNDLQELRETAIYLSSRLDVVMSIAGPKPPSAPQVTASEPATGLGVQLAEMKHVVNNARDILGDIIDRLEI